MKIEPIDVTVATYNSEKTIKKCLDAIIKNIPYREIVVVDNGSTDNTLKILEKYKDKNVRVVHQSGYLGAVRYRQALETTGEWIAIIDSDVYVYENWWDKMISLVDKNVGMIMGKCYVEYPDFYSDYFRWMVKKMGTVGFSNVLIRRKFITKTKNKKLVGLHGGEDLAVYKEIIKNGYIVPMTDEFVAEHENIDLNGLRMRAFRSGFSMKLERGISGALLKNLINEVSKIYLLLKYFLYKRNISHEDLKLINFLLVEEPILYIIGIFHNEKR